MYNHPNRPRYPVYYQVPSQTHYIPTEVNEPAAVNEAQFIQQFLNADGQVDVGKVLQTVNQLADTVQQIAPVIKQVNDLVKTWKS